MGFHSNWSCFTLRSVTKDNLWNGFPSSLELFYPSFCEPLKWVSILTGVVLLRSVWWVSIHTGVVLTFVLWPNITFEMGFHSHWSCVTLRSVIKVNFEMGFHSNWSCFTLRSVTKDNLWNWFPSSLELFYCSFCDQREPLKWVSILTGVVLPFVLWPKRTF